MHGTAFQRTFDNSLPQCWSDAPAAMAVEPRSAIDLAAIDSLRSRPRLRSAMDVGDRAPTARLRNRSAFVAAFDVKPGEAMYRPKNERMSLWQTDREVVCPGKAP